MKRTRLLTVILTFALAAVGYGLYAGNPAQHRQPSGGRSQPAEPRQSPPPEAARPANPAPQHQPSSGPQSGRSQPPGAPTVGRAEPRQGPPAHAGRPGHGGMVYYPGPWYGWYGFPWYPVGYPWVYAPPYSIAADWSTSSIRLEVTPREARVYVDRYYTGTIDDFDGFFQSLTVPAGPHAIEIRKDGYRTIVLDVNLQPGQTIRYKASMEPAGLSTATETVPAIAAAPVDDPEQFIPVPGYVRFDVKPKDAAVYADGFYAGLADDFSGASQLLVLAPGRHHIELRAAGYVDVEFDADIRSGQTLESHQALLRQ
jgi:hypothetical protein